MTGNTPQKYDSRTADKFVVRLPPGLRDKIAVAAKANHRSMNSEIIRRLLESMGEEVHSDQPVQSQTVWIPRINELVKSTSPGSQAGYFIIKGFKEYTHGFIVAELESVRTGKGIGLYLSELEPITIDL